MSIDDLDGWREVEAKLNHINHFFAKENAVCLKHCSPEAIQDRLAGDFVVFFGAVKANQRGKKMSNMNGF